MYLTKVTTFDTNQLGLYSLYIFIKCVKTVAHTNNIGINILTKEYTQKFLICDLLVKLNATKNQIMNKNYSLDFD